MLPLSFQLLTFDQENPQHRSFVEELIKGNEMKFVKQIKERLQRSSYQDSFLERAYLVASSKDLIGYLYLSGIKRNSIYLEYLIAPSKRRQGYASRLLEEVSDYLFSNYPLEKILLDIDQGNYPSMKTALAAGFSYDTDEYVQGLDGTNRISFEKVNLNYVNKRKKGR